MNAGTENTNKRIKIKFVKDWPERDIIALYKSAEWWKRSYDPSGIQKIIEGSFAFVVAIDTVQQKAVGMGRLISDGVSDAYIQDLVVLPEYRGKGIGQQLVTTLLSYCQRHHLSWIGLIAEPDQEGFYSRLGFRPLAGYSPMKYKQR